MFGLGIWWFWFGFVCSIDPPHFFDTTSPHSFSSSFVTQTLFDSSQANQLKQDFSPLSIHLDMQPPEIGATAPKNPPAQ
jgi:hypothetical protein